MPYIKTYKGNKFHYNNITKDSIDVLDILHSLPRINRFIGHSTRPYSVGEHTFIGLAMAEKLGYTAMQRFHWFIHDFTEAYVGDCPAPLKKLLPKFSEIEADVESAILDFFGLPELTEDEFRMVKRIDMTMLVIEMRDLTLHNHEEFIDENTYLEILEDENFVLSQEPVDDKLLNKVLKSLYNDLVKELGICQEI